MPAIIFVCAVVAVVFMWKDFVQPIGVVGTVETIQANVTCVQDGLMMALNVDRFERVTKNQELGKVDKLDPELLTASLAAISANLQVMRSRIALDRQGNEQRYQQIRMDLLNQKVLLASARMNFIQASNEFNRVSELFNQVPRLESVSNFDLARAKQDSLLAEIEERLKLLKDMDESLMRMGLTETATKTKDPIDLALEAEERQFQLTMQPMMLKAPIDGVVSMVLKHPGERILKGEPILTISTPHAERIIGYIRQPVNFTPSINDIVTVRTRSQKRVVGNGQILKIGAQMEMINPALLSVDTKRMEVGLPILVSVPPGLKVLPGEFVDLTIQYTKK